MPALRLGPVLLRSLALASVPAACALGMSGLPSRLLYHPDLPGRELVATPGDAGLAYESVDLNTEDGLRLHGWFVPAAEDRGTLIFFHGNAGNISHRLVYLRLCHALGMNTLIFDYRGYGRSEGRPTEAGLYHDAEAALRHLTDDRGLEPGEVVYFGRSLGGSVAAWLASRHPPAGLIVESSFTSIPDLAGDLYPWLPTGWIGLRYATLEYVQAQRSPLLVVHSPDDEIIPFRHGRRIYEAARPPKRFLEIRGGHNSGPAAGGERYAGALDAFLTEALGGPR